MLSLAVVLATIIAVHDGDTITVGHNGITTVIRLAEIDAPELKQPHGEQSRQSLTALCLGKNAKYSFVTRDKYRRTVARVSCAGTDASREQVRAGMAWVFDRYVTDVSLYDTQNEAQASRRGLWMDANPTPPWEWRNKKH